MIQKIFKNIGPATLITAAFIGPGTVTLCTIAGVDFGYELLWTMVLAILATIFLQEMVARVGIVSQKGISEIIRKNFRSVLGRSILIFLIISAILIGNSAYQAGNISGAVLGLETTLGDIQYKSVNYKLYPAIIGAIVIGIVFIGNYKTLEKIFISIVLLMSICFLISVILFSPPIKEIIKGLFIPKIPSGSIFTVIGLIGTTVVPYNLFLHANLSKQKWKSPENIPQSLWDLIISVTVGGVISISIIITAAASNLSDVTNAVDLAIGIEPLMGTYSKFLIGFGLFAAGLTSAITAPLAAAYVACNCFGWNTSFNSMRFKGVFLTVLIFGVLVSSFNIQLIEVIKFAQVTNGILLPIIVGIILLIVNRSDILGRHVNSLIQNVIGFVILILAGILSFRSIYSLFDLI
ncbi:MAG: Nramp family divalent metal transporter [Flavobacteriaceae bacterium]|nr:Nramp family divalent metal transporter [Flavobacteriaceae bacterium]